MKIPKMRNTIQKKLNFRNPTIKQDTAAAAVPVFVYFSGSYSTSSRSKPLKPVKQVFTQQVPFRSTSEQHQVGWLRFNSAFNTN